MFYMSNLYFGLQKMNKRNAPAYCEDCSGQCWAALLDLVQVRNFSVGRKKARKSPAH